MNVRKFKEIIMENNFNAENFRMFRVWEKIAMITTKKAWVLLIEIQK